MLILKISIHRYCGLKGGIVNGNKEKAPAKKMAAKKPAKKAVKKAAPKKKKNNLIGFNN